MSPALPSSDYLEAYVDYSLYVEAKINADEMPYTFAQWWEIEARLRGDQLTIIDTDEKGGITLT